jgi:phosphatidylglycerophosphate synthase
VFAAGVLVVSVTMALRQVARMPADGEARGVGSAWLGPRVRAWYRSALRPAEDWIAARGWSPDALTYAQLALSVGAGWAYANACILLGGCVLLTAGSLDVLDGGLARRQGVAGRRGALVDSVVDRWAEFATFVGLGALFRDGWMLLVVALAAFGSQMVSYVRARGEGLGLEMTTGRAQRAERYVLLGFGSVVSGILGHLFCPTTGGTGRDILAAFVLGLAAVSVATALERVRHAANALRKDAP